MSLISWLDQTFYPTHPHRWDDRLFREEILATLRPGMKVLDLGAGAGIIPEMDFRSTATVFGIDVDQRVLANPHLDDARIADAEAIPYPDDWFDLVISDNVLEHLERPEAVFREVARILRPGGRFLAKTPNRRHYVALISMLTPLAFHRWFNTGRGRDRVDIFPTFYRANRRSAICRYAFDAGLTPARIEFHEGRPEYLRFSSFSYLVGCAYERLVNAHRIFERLRVVIIAELTKPTQPSASVDR